MIKPEVLDAMVAAGCTAEQIAAAVKADIGSRQSNAERQARFRARRREARNASNVTGVTVTLDNAPSPSLDKEKVEPKEINPTPARESNKPARETDLDQFKAELHDVSAEALDGLIKLRRTKQAPITGLAARKFRGWAEQCGLSMQEAAEECVGSNWLVVKPEYLQGRQRLAPQARGSPQPVNGKPTVIDALAARKAARDGRNGGNGNRGDAELFPPGRSEPAPAHGELRSGPNGRYVSRDH